LFVYHGSFGVLVRVHCWWDYNSCDYVFLRTLIIFYVPSCSFISCFHVAFLSVHRQESGRRSGFVSSVVCFIGTLVVWVLYMFVMYYFSSHIWADKSILLGIGVFF